MHSAVCLQWGFSKLNSFQSYGIALLSWWARASIILMSFQNEENGELPISVSYTGTNLSSPRMCPFDCRDLVTSSYDIFPPRLDLWIYRLERDPSVRDQLYHGYQLTAAHDVDSQRNREQPSKWRPSWLLDLINQMLHQEAGKRPSAFEVLEFVLSREQQQNSWDNSKTDKSGNTWSRWGI